MLKGRSRPRRVVTNLFPCVSEDHSPTYLLTDSSVDQRVGQDHRGGDGAAGRADSLAVERVADGHVTLDGETAS